MAKYIHAATAAEDVAKVRHGKWQKVGDGKMQVCPFCGAMVEIRRRYKYCPACGAKMDGGSDK